MCLQAKADEGMWMINAIDQALEKKMQERGLKLSAGEIYNADAPGTTISDAVVSLEFGCTGSMISDRGLMITNHHCAYSDVYALSTEEHNYLEDGYWAMTSGQEVPIKGKKVYFLKRVLDVTAEAEGMLAEAESRGEVLGSRKLGFLMEKKYKEQSGLEAWFSSMWSGSKYYVALYEVYSDVRLVAAPPVSVAAFGGDIDNWEWPQHKCDFALYRIYTAPDGSPAEYSDGNIPLRPDRTLRISLDGYEPGDFAMVIGFPGITHRYSSSYAVDFKERVSLPVSNRLRADQMSIINSWMERDPSVRLKYSDYYFSLSNVQEMNEGEVQCYRRFNVVEAKASLEKLLQEWIESDPERDAVWGDMLALASRKYSATEQVQRNLVYYRETLVRGTRFSRIVPRINVLKNDVLKSKGMRPLEYLEKLGWTGPDVWYAHGIHFNDEELKVLASTGTGIAHCPVSNMKLGSGVCRVPEMLQLGIDVALGVDGSASNDGSDLMAEMRACYLLHRLVSSYDAPSGYDVLKMATVGGAKVLGRKDIGHLKEGMRADLFAVRTDCIELAGATFGPESMLATVGLSRPVDLTIINGRVVAEDGHLVLADEDEIYRNADKAVHSYLGR